MTIQESHETEHVHSESSPFIDNVEVERFFPGGNRQAVLEELLQAICDAVPIVTLTGEEGCGKTMICRMVERALPSDYVTVFFPQMVDSFEDVVRLIAHRLEVDPAVAAGDIPTLLQTIAATLREKVLRLLVIFDEAERIYLATLERVRKMLDLVNSSGPLMQIMLSGRSGLHNNFKNLALCNFLEVEERHVALEPLDLQETGAYLNHALQFGDIGGKKPIISPEITERIFLASGGNFRLVN
ncbi:MAG: AAA family ATPase, partial [Desulfobulbaceae bacterium]